MEFGKKVSDARLKKGMTQKELADACDVDIRTIQRIEADEVTPRTYTIKLLGNVLDLALEESDNRNNKITTEINLTLTLACIFGIVFIVNNILFIFIENRLSLKPGDHVFFNVWLGMAVVYVTTFVFFFIGLYYIGRIYHQTIIKIATLLPLIFVPIYIIFSALTFQINNPLFLQLRMITIIILGIGAISLGIGLLFLNSKRKIFAEIAGILQILCGLLFIIPFGVSQFFGLILTFPANILLLIVIYLEKNSIEK
jgi:transcriptional regulator with XRE-family HTH domain